MGHTPIRINIQYLPTRPNAPNRGPIINLPDPLFNSPATSSIRNLNRVSSSCTPISFHTFPIPPKKTHKRQQLTSTSSSSSDKSQQLSLDLISHLYPPKSGFSPKTLISLRSLQPQLPILSFSRTPTKKPYKSQFHLVSN